MASAWQVFNRKLHITEGQPRTTFLHAERSKRASRNLAQEAARLPGTTWCAELQHAREGVIYSDLQALGHQQLVIGHISKPWLSHD